ncbi:MAG: hypothetical protein IID44_30620 [Planctomycetes bacterium]|nr:hypothetical protein [Planctomycetota bacterium]
MATSNSSDFDAVYDRVSEWPEERQIEFADRILRALGDSLPAEQARQSQDLRRLVGLFATEGPPPTDEECEKIIEEARLRKYG